ncbi:MULTISPECIES: alpha-D-ribose 1-methylphosphonate 5-triphosphate diphosphatase [unclassified Rhizobium]|jgi:alpha-D-ribose 1-methylphosphonate 5-triphosphate diphosphatase|uniref:alpha-D-ribose 1-methylphosphonate 5-triphosphate diphosphatase n=1 Tax=unclassified Rhizobium TaxID=2613769 RepID=UPI0003740C0C|nr:MULTISPECIES: alpha-D-ribose 1-methylphosphonate 5-triphosphate diphosphatase [unclassified Rhizobium]MBO9122123.1 alpha-D-ribose 1-methylphosphonate 5-triphosphate diphosphatase [Rhizobium sp. 16-488-2b]MBO9172807.1 alpha-D-ribose 1-methylphosphonate 5-triphosphate diphosphatase [Rhizobium sp. 16-488-2a]MBO9192645.1 alpha-D-ribose 1-methylphosphonate 5-triphosphate diphosphatase [Rhizobium sp. 16-449-1b]
MTKETVFSNARIVLEDEIVEGSVLVRDGKIEDIASGSSRLGEDFEGDYLIPGLVELHTDHLEGHYSPRPGLRWNKTAAIQAHDAQIVTSGITTVFDCLRMGADEDGGFEHGEMRDMADAIQKAEKEGRLRAEHLIHLRCEVSADNVLQHFADFENDPYVRLVSLMDHAPGQRQFQTMDQYIFYYQKKRGLTDAEFAKFVDRRVSESERNSTPHRVAISKVCAERGITVASHDDATLAHVDEAIENGVRLAEFPTSFDAAKASHENGMSVLMGAPNIVRGKSHSGNIAARDLAERGVLDVLSSDYVPLSLLYAPFLIADEVESISLPKAIAMVTSTPARTVSLNDRGRIATGLRADLVRVFRDEGVPVSRSVWREGRRVA